LRFSPLFLLGNILDGYRRFSYSHSFRWIDGEGARGRTSPAGRISNENTAHAHHGSRKVSLKWNEDNLSGRRIFEQIKNLRSENAPSFTPGYWEGTESKKRFPFLFA